MRSKGFFLIFSLFLGVGSMICLYHVKLPIHEALIGSFILALIFGGFTRSMIRMTNKDYWRKKASTIFWTCFLLLGIILSGIFSQYIGVIWGLLVGFGIGLLIGLIGGALRFLDDW